MKRSLIFTIFIKFKMVHHLLFTVECMAKPLAERKLKHEQFDARLIQKLVETEFQTQIRLNNKTGIQELC